MKEKKEAFLSAIKEAMKGELTSADNYQMAAEKSEDEDVKKFFIDRVEEEKKHFNYLLEYYKFFDVNEEMSDEIQNLNISDKQEQVFTPQFIQRISENQILFSAISIAILLEKNAMQFYQKQAEKTEISNLRNFFKLMAKWEEIHYDEVMEISRLAEEKYWQMNDFVPF
jgi:rubrerythrin